LHTVIRQGTPNATGRARDDRHFVFERLHSSSFVGDREAVAIHRGSRRRFALRSNSSVPLRSLCFRDPLHLSRTPFKRLAVDRPQPRVRATYETESRLTSRPVAVRNPSAFRMSTIAAYSCVGTNSRIRSTAAAGVFTDPPDRWARHRHCRLGLVLEALQLFRV